jgi:beta-propeller repeat-containing protein
LSRTGGYTLFLTGDEAVFALRWSNATHASSSDRDGKYAASPSNERTTGAVLRMKLRNANHVANVTGESQLGGTSHYLIGNDPTNWRSNVPTYAKVRYEEIYPGIDLVYYGNQQQLEYDFIVAPGVDARCIAFDVLGAKRIRRDESGDFVLSVGEGEIRWRKPVAYQEKNGTRQLVAAHCTLTATNRIGFTIADYDARRPLYIDPLIYSTYLGGSASDSADGIAVDNSGNVYVAGSTDSTDFPAVNPLQPIKAGNFDVFITKINPTGSAVIYSTYLGGSRNDYNPKIAVDTAGNAYITSYTNSYDFPTMNALQPAHSGGDGDAFVTKLDATGSAFVYSTYLGGSNGDSGSDVAVDSSGNAYVVGSTSSTDFPTKNPIQPENAGGYSSFSDVFVSKINAAGSAFVYSTYLGGNDGDYGTGIAVNGWGSAYVTGWTASNDFPITPGAFQMFCKANGSYGCMGGPDAFVTRLNGTGSALVYSTYLGGGQLDRAYDIAVDTAQNAYVTGETYSTDFPTMNPMQPTSGRTTDGFVTKLNPSGTSLVYSTYLGGGGIYEGAGGIAVDGSGHAYVTGTTNSLDFPTVNALQPSYRGGSEDAFVSKFNPAGSALVYSTYLGGKGYDSGRAIAVDRSGNAYVTGITNANFPTKNPLQSINAGGGDAFVAKIDVRAVPLTTLLSSLNPSTYGQAATITANVTSNLGTPTDGEIITFKKGSMVTGNRRVEWRVGQFHHLHINGGNESDHRDL